MSTTPNLLIPHIAASQNQKEVTANFAFDSLDEGLTDKLAVAMSDADYTLGAAAGGEALAHLVFVFTGALTANRNIIVPNNKKLYIVSNQTSGGHNLVVKTAAVAGVAVTAGTYSLLYCDGTSVLAISAGAAGATAFTGLTDVPGTYSGAGSKRVEVNSGATALVFVARPYKLGAFIAGTYTSSQVLVAIPLDEAVTLPANLAGAQATLTAAVTASTTFVVKKNGSSIGTIVFASGSTATSFTTSGGVAQTFAAGDIFSVEAPASADATAAGLGFVLKGTF